MLKDYFDTFKPYKSWFYIKRDLMLPRHGSRLIWAGLKSIVFGLKHQKTRPTWLGLTGILRGAIQILATPLTCFIRIPLRGVLTISTGFIPIEENFKIQQEIASGIEILTVLYDFNKIIDGKCELEKKIKKYSESEDPSLKAKVPKKIESLKKINELRQSLDKEIKEIIAQANYIGATLQRKLEKGCQRKQPSSIHELKPIEIETDTETGKPNLDSFKDGLCLFALNKKYLFSQPQNNKDAILNLENNQAKIQRKI